MRDQLWDLVAVDVGASRYSYALSYGPYSVSPKFFVRNTAI